MSGILPHVRAGDPISAKHYNRLIDAVSRALKITGNGGIRVSQNASGTQLSVSSAPQSFPFILTQDTPQGQGYVTATRLYWSGSVWHQLSGDPEFKVYDPLDLSPGPEQYPYPSEWTKDSFVGRAIWSYDRGEWEILTIQHVAKFINFTLTADLASGDTTATGSFTDFWDGVTPAGGNSGDINLLTSPRSDYKATSGAKGTAVWRNDLGQ